MQTTFLWMIHASRSPLRYDIASLWRVRVVEGSYRLNLDSIAPPTCLLMLRAGSELYFLSHFNYALNLLYLNYQGDKTTRPDSHTFGIIPNTHNGTRNFVRISLVYHRLSMLNLSALLFQYLEMVSGVVRIAAQNLPKKNRRWHCITVPSLLTLKGCDCGCLVSRTRQVRLFRKDLGCGLCSCILALEVGLSLMGWDAPVHMVAVERAATRVSAAESMGGGLQAVALSASCEAAHNDDEP
jgi:hypothetical protein